MCELCGKGEGELEVGGEGWCVDCLVEVGEEVLNRMLKEVEDEEEGVL